MIHLLDSFFIFPVQSHSFSWINVFSLWFICLEHFWLSKLSQPIERLFHKEIWLDIFQLWCHFRIQLAFKYMSQSENSWKNVWFNWNVISISVNLNGMSHLRVHLYRLSSFFSCPFVQLEIVVGICRDLMVKWNFGVVLRLHSVHSYFWHHLDDVILTCRA